MKKILFYSTLIICTTFYSQDDWTLYPKKENLDSLNLQSSELSKKTKQDLPSRLNPIYNDSLHYISKEGVLIENKDSKIESINNYLSENGTYNGFTVQLYFSQKTDDVREIRKKFISKFPDKILFDEYIAPNIFCILGNFKTTIMLFFQK
tara:strand:+ start:287 stop:736 length:450 start_codon:yes stop_codon:yes gene_type:complete